MFEKLFLTVISSAVQSVTGTVTGPYIERLLGRAERRLAEERIEASHQAVTAAVEAARRELVSEYWKGEDARSRDVVELLQHRPFAEEVTRRVLHEGQPDFDRLRAYYFDEGNTSERWESLRPMLEDFFDLIGNHLETGPLGDALRDSRNLVHRTETLDIVSLIRQDGEAIRLYQQHLTKSGDERNDLLRTSTATLAELKTLLQSALKELGEIAAARYSQRPLSANEKTFLRLLRSECDQLPLEEKNVGGRRASLRRVYVDLESDQEPAFPKVLQRLGVSPEHQAGALGRLEKRLELWPHVSSGQGAAHIVRMSPDLLLRGDKDELADDHPFKEWAEDREHLADVLYPLSALEALLDKRHLVLLGDPGSGKSTFVHHLAIANAGGLLGDDPDWGEALEGHLEEPFFPLRVVLRKLSPELDPEKRPLPQLYAHILAQRGELSSEELRDRLESPRTLMLFDGLDEVPASDGKGEFDRRRYLIDMVGAYLEAHPDGLVLVTCRVKPYESGTYQVPGLAAARLAPLDGPRIQEFCQRWYRELGELGHLDPQVATERRDRLLRVLGERDDLLGMARTPLLLTMLAQVNSREALPDSRAELYHRCVEQLLWRWEERKSDGGGRVKGLHDLLDEAPGRVDKTDFESVLWRLTSDAHAQSGERDAVLLGRGIRAALEDLLPDKPSRRVWAMQVTDLMAQRGGLLNVLNEDDVFTFPHRSFQEYLAACWLTKQVKASSRIAEELAPLDGWREVILLTCGILRYQGDRVNDLQAILLALVDGEPSDAFWRRVTLAGEAWKEFGPQRHEGPVGKMLLRKIPDLLTRCMQTRSVPAQQRWDAGALAADLGALPGDLDDFVIFQETPFGYPLWVAKYPVTNAQYQRFVDAGGYDRKAGWISETGQNEIMKYLIEWPDGPRSADDLRFNRSTQPVVAISWYEAEAYCKWWTTRLREQGTISEDQSVRLLKEEERQWIAGSSKERKYPWGEDAEVDRLNCEESGLEKPSPVHMYPDGKTPEGVWDLSGNVWEWTSTEEGASSPAYVFGGGSWYTNISLDTSAARDWYYAHFAWNNYGFRVSVSPLLI